MNQPYIDPTIYTGRPKDLTGRFPGEIRTYQLLDRLEIPYERLDHEAVFTIEGCHQIEHILNMEKYLSLTPGSVSVLGLMNDTENHVRLLIDRQVIEGHAFIGCHPCVNTSSLKIRTADILEKFLPCISHPYTLVQ